MWRTGVIVTSLALILMLPALVAVWFVTTPRLGTWQIAGPDPIVDTERGSVHYKSDRTNPRPTPRPTRRSEQADRHQDAPFRYARPELPASMRVVPGNDFWV